MSGGGTWPGPDEQPLWINQDHLASGWSQVSEFATLMDALRRDQARPSSGTNARLAGLVDALFKSPKFAGTRASSLYAILEKYGWRLGEFANQFDHELTASEMQELGRDLRGFAATHSAPVATAAAASAAAEQGQNSRQGGGGGTATMVRKTHLLRHCVLKMIGQDRLGTKTQGKLKQRCIFHRRKRTRTTKQLQMERRRGVRTQDGRLMSSH